MPSEGCFHHPCAVRSADEMGAEMNKYSVGTCLDYLPQNSREALQMLNRAYYHLRNQEKDGGPYKTLAARKLIEAASQELADELMEVA